MKRQDCRFPPSAPKMAISESHAIRIWGRPAAKITVSSTADFDVLRCFELRDGNLGLRSCGMEQHEAWQGDVARKERISARRQAGMTVYQPLRLPANGITTVCTVFWNTGLASSHDAVRRNSTMALPRGQSVETCWTTEGRSKTSGSRHWIAVDIH